MATKGFMPRPPYFVVLLLVLGLVLVPRSRNDTSRTRRRTKDEDDSSAPSKLPYAEGRDFSRCDPLLCVPGFATKGQYRQQRQERQKIPAALLPAHAFLLERAAGNRRTRCSADDRLNVAAVCRERHHFGLQGVRRLAQCFVL